MHASFLGRAGKETTADDAFDLERVAFGTCKSLAAVHYSLENPARILATLKKCFVKFGILCIKWIDPASKSGL